MGLFGGTGCSLLTSAEFVIPLTNFNGIGVVTIPIPNDPTLIHFPFYVQGMVNDAAANPLGLVFSNAAAGLAGN